jgi:mono/diheme cytochrome c family protein
MKILASKNALVGLTLMVGLSCAAQAQSGAEAAYKAKCAMCHGADGAGNTPAGKSMGAKDFRAPAVVSETDAQLQGVIENGRNKMPAYQGKLTAADVGGLVKYIRQLQGK